MAQFVCASRLIYLSSIRRRNIASCDVDRSFSMYENVLRDNYTSENLNRLSLVAFAIKNAHLHAAWWDLYFILADSESEAPTWRDIGEEVKKPRSDAASLRYGKPHDWTEEDDEEQSQWCYLPDLIMERIFSYLSISERYSASIVCKRWNSAFYLPYVWHVFQFDELTLTRRRFNYYSGWQHTLDHLRAQLCLGTVGRYFQVVIFTPITNFYNMYEFMNMISFYAEQQDSDRCPVKGISRNIKTLRYIFPCKYLSGDEDESPQELPLYGTGGKLLDAVKRLMGNLTNLRRLELTDLMLDNAEAMTLLDDVCCECCQTLRHLSLSNFTKGQYQLLHLGVFVNLQVLVVGPQNLGEQVMELISNTRLKHLHIVQTRLTPVSAQPLSPKCWQAAAKRNPSMRVHLALETKTERPLLWQEKAPVSSILVDSPLCKLEPDIVMRIIQWYSDHLRYFGYLGIPKYHQPKSFDERMDPFFVMLVKECPKIETFVIREKVSASTVLLVAEECKLLKKFYVRRNAVILVCDWPHNPNWEDGYYSWLKKSSRSYEETENEVSRLLGFRWKMLSDKEFVMLNPPLYSYT